MALVKGHLDFKIRTCFASKTVGSFEIKVHVKE